MPAVPDGATSAMVPSVVVTLALVSVTLLLPVTAADMTPLNRLLFALSEMLPPEVKLAGPSTVRLVPPACPIAPPEVTDRLPVPARLELPSVTGAATAIVSLPDVVLFNASMPKTVAGFAT